MVTEMKGKLRRDTAVCVLAAALIMGAAFSRPVMASEPLTSEEAAKKVSGYESDIAATKEALSDTESRIAELEEEVSRLESECRDTYLAMEEYRDGMTERICYFYENSRTGNLIAFLSGDTADVLNRLVMQQALYSYDKEQLSLYLACADELSAREDELAEKEAELESLYAEQEEELSALTDALSDAEDEYAEAVRREAIEAAKANITDTQEESAEKIYSVLKYIGWTDVMISGALGNIQSESGLDPSAVETVYNEKFTWGEKKQAADEADYLMSVVNPSYRYKSVLRCGIGLIQWTDTTSGARGNTNLRKYAEKNGAAWYDIDVQLRYLTHTDGDKRRAKCILNPEKYTKYDMETVSGAVGWWAYYIEGSSRKSEKKESFAESWLTLIENGALTYDEEYAKGIMED